MSSVEGTASAAFTACIVGETTLPIQCAEILLQRGHRVRCMVSDDPQVLAWAQTRGVDHAPLSRNLAARLASEPFDYLFSIANLRLLDRDLLALARMSAINYHDGPLPRYAGLNAPAWAILNQESDYGITWHLMSDQVDAGPVLVSRDVAIDPSDTALTVNAKCYEAAIDSFSDLLDGMAAGALVPREQDLGRRTLFGRDQRPPAACVLDWERPAAELSALVRALTAGDYPNPLGTPKVFVGDELLAVCELERLGRSGALPGTVTGVGDTSIWVASADADVALRGLTTLEGEPLEPRLVAERHLLAPGARLPVIGDSSAALRELHEALARHETAWTQRLSALEPAQVPYARDVPAGSSAGYASCGLDLPANARAPGGEDGLLAALAAYLGRLTGSDRFDVGLARPALDGCLAGFDQMLAQPLPLHVEIDLAGPFAEASEAVRVELGRVRERRGFLRDLRQREPRLRERTSPLPVVLAAGAPAGEPPPDAHLVVAVTDGGARLEWTHRTDVLEAADVKRMQRQLLTFLADLSAHPDRPLADLAILDPEERHRLLVEWNATAVGYERGECVHEAVAAQVDRTPDAEALVVGERRLSYRELDGEANRLARRLRRLGVGRGSRVGLYLDRSVEMVVGLLGILKSGAAYVPMDPEFPARRLGFMVEDAGVGVVVSRRGLAGELPGGVRVVEVDGGEVGEESGERVASGVESEEIAYVIYTSGSTGTPKGVQVRHRNVVNFFAGMDRRLETGPGGVWLAVTSISFDISVLELFWTLARGFRVVLYPDDPAEAADPPPAAASPASASTATLDFSLFHFGASEGPSPNDKYRLLVEGARFGDEHGFAAVWTPERHFHAFGGLYPNPAVVGAGIATMTKRIGIRAGSCVSPLHSAVRIAEEWSVVDNLSDGRVGVSFASGWQPDDFVLAPDAFADRKALMGRQIDMVRRLWRGESVWLPGPLGKDVQVSVLPRPIQPELPVWVTSAGSPDTFRVAGEMGCNVLTHLLGQSLEELAEKVRAYRDAWRATGRGPGNGHVTLMLHSFVGADDQEMKERVRGPMKEYLRSSVGLIQRAAWTFPAFKRATTDAEGRFALDNLSPEDMDAVLDFSFERYYETSGLLGSPEKCLRLIDDLRGIGIDEIACLIDFVDDTELVLDHLPDLDQVRERATRAASAGARRGDVHPVARLLREESVTHLQCTPSMASLLLSSPGCREAMGGLRQLLVGGEALPAGLARELREAVGGSVVNMYGPTETTIWSTTQEVGEAGEGETVAIGRPIANTTCYVLDGGMRPVPVGVVGELWIGGEGVTAGYLGRPELNRERFVEDGYGRGGGWLYRTGDLARYREDGVLEYLGRVDTQVKLRGYRLELGEIESVLSTHPGVRENAVVVRDGGGGGEGRLVAYVVGHRGEAPEGGELRGYLEERLPKYMVPAVYVAMERLPQTPNGKLDRRALPEPDTRRRDTERELVAPRDDLEQELAAIWERALGVTPIGVDESFFQLGGHSLMAVQVFNEIERSVGERLPLSTLFRAPTIRLLAEVLRES